MGLAASATGQQGGKTDIWSLKQLCGVTSIPKCLQVVEEGKREYILTVGF